MYIYMYYTSTVFVLCVAFLEILWKKWSYYGISVKGHEIGSL